MPNTLTHRLLAVSFVSALSFAGLPAMAASVLDQEYLVPSSDGTGLQAGRPIPYQTFTVGIGGTLDAVGVQVVAGSIFNSALRPTEDLVVSVLETDVNGVPDPNQVLGSVNLAPSEFPTPVFYNDVFTLADFSGFNLLVNPGDVLAIRLHTDESTGLYTLSQFTGSTYLGGAQFTGSDLAATPTLFGTQSLPNDFGFQTYVNTASTIPHPAALSMGLLGLCGLVLKRRRR